MGNKQTHINDFSKINIPDDYTIIKLISYDVNLYNSIAMRENVYEIIKYIFGSDDKKNADIICLQNIQDKYALYDLVKSIKKTTINKNLSIYLCPAFNDISVDTKEIDNSFDIIWSNSKPVSHDYEYNVNNIIISRFPIISYSVTKLSEDNRTIIAANINIKNKIVSVYNTYLSNDLINTHIDNKTLRNHEIDKLESVINQNKHLISTSVKYVYYRKSDIHLIVGNLNIKETSFKTLTDEYIDIVKDKHYIDVYRLQNPDIIGNTNIFNTRTSYIICKLLDKYCEKQSKYYKMLKKIKEPNDILKILFKEHQLYFIQTFVNYAIDYRNYYPIECIFMLKI